MRPQLWLLLYGLSVLLMVPTFFAILYAKATTNNPKLWPDDAEKERKQAKVDSWSSAILYALVWPIGLVIMGVILVTSSIKFGTPKEIRRVMKRRHDRAVIRRYEEEQYGETKDLP
jgi:hypothetical protein